jgi:hypothetical protein
VISKCGLRRRHHFSHLAGEHCANPEGDKPADAGAAPAATGRRTEPETGWHQNWKAAFPAAWREVRLGERCADIHAPRGLTIEFQHSPLSYAEVRERTAYYLKFGPLVWVVDAGALMTGLCLGALLSDQARPHHLFFTAKRLPPGFNQVRQVWLDLGQLPTCPVPLVCRVTQWPGRHWGGKGFALSRQVFIAHLLNQEVPRPWLCHSPIV